MGHLDRITFKNLGVILEDHNGYYKLYSLDLKESVTWACYDRDIWFDRLVEWNDIYTLHYKETIEKIMVF